MIKALVLGELCEDILLHNPAGVEVMGQKTWAKDIVLSAGGSTYYTGAALLHLGADVKISSVLGTDEAGDRVYNQMMLDGLNICHTERLPGRKTTKSMMVCDGGDKQFIGCTPMLPLKIPEWLALKGSDLFYIAGYTLYPELWEEEMVNLCCKAKRHGVCIAMDSQLLPIVGDNLAQISNTFLVCNDEKVSQKHNSALRCDADAVLVGPLHGTDVCHTIPVRYGPDGWTNRRDPGHCQQRSAPGLHSGQ